MLRSIHYRASSGLDNGWQIMTNSAQMQEQRLEGTRTDEEWRAEAAVQSFLRRSARSLTDHR